MICYLDRTFCRFWEQCRKGDVCDRALTDLVSEAADRIGLPISQYAERPECFRERNESE